MGAEFELAGLVRAAEADDHGLSSDVNESLEPGLCLRNVAGENALGASHSLKGHVVVAFNELAHLLFRLRFVLIDVEGGVEGFV